MKLYCSDKRYISVSLLKVPPVKGSMDLKHVIYEFYYKRAIRGEGADLPAFFLKIDKSPLIVSFLEFLRENSQIFPWKPFSLQR